MSSRLAEFCLRSLKACAAPRANEDRLVGAGLPWPPYSGVLAKGSAEGLQRLSWWLVRPAVLNRWNGECLARGCKKATSVPGSCVDASAARPA